MSKERSRVRWLEHKVVPGFCSALVLCLLLLVLLYFPYEEGPLNRNVSACSACKLKLELAEEEHIRQLVTNVSNPVYIEENCTSPRQEDTPELVKVIEGWELPAVTDDRPEEKLDGPETYGEVRRFKPMGSGAFLFIQFGAYRGGTNTFAVVGLGTKGLHSHGNPGFECSWVSNGDNSTLEGKTTKYLPDWGYGKEYTVVVVNCTFECDVGVDGSGGRLEFVANHGSRDHTGLPDVHFVALGEAPKTFDGSIFGPPYKYDYLYCGSPLFGDISPQRMRHWIAYHVRLMGVRSHFILYDAGGLRDDVRKILEPWVKLGFVTVSNIRQEARYNVYYYSQFLINNDCLFRAKTLANWTFFFDVDEYIHVQAPFTVDQVMSKFYDMGRTAQQVMLTQKFMDHNHCVRNDSLSADDLQRQWGFEKLVYRRTQDIIHSRFSDRKYAIQAQYALATAVHGSVNTLLPDRTRLQNTILYDDWRMDYYHYHGTINIRAELCQNFVDPALNSTKIENITHVYDNGLAVVGDTVRAFELQTIGKPTPSVR